MSNPLNVIGPRLCEIPCAPCGVYFLLSGSEIVYVGKGKDVNARIAAHERRFSGEFDRAFYLPLPAGDLLLYEGALIRYFRPRLCEYAPRHLGRDNEVLVSLGLTPHDDENAVARDFARQRLVAFRARKAARKPERDAWVRSVNRAVRAGRKQVA